jgi:hypothetical protein
MRNETQLNGNGMIRNYDNGIREICVPHLGEKVYYNLPQRAQPCKFQEAVEDNLQKSRALPTIAHAFSLISLALQNKNEENCRQIIESLNCNGMHTATRVLYSQNRLIIYDDPDGDAEKGTIRATLYDATRGGHWEKARGYSWIPGSFYYRNGMRSVKGADRPWGSELKFQDLSPEELARSPVIEALTCQLWDVNSALSKSIEQSARIKTNDLSLLKSHIRIPNQWYLEATRIRGVENLDAPLSLSRSPRDGYGIVIDDAESKRRFNFAITGVRK